MVLSIEEALPLSPQGCVSFASQGSRAVVLRFLAVRKPWNVSVVNNLPVNAGTTGDAGSTPGSGRSPGGRNGNPRQYSCLENPIDRGARQATVHGVTRVRHNLVTEPLLQSIICAKDKAVLELFHLI